jgi:hypothetical protein
MDIIYPEGKFPKDDHPICVMVEFQQYTGLPFIQKNPKLVPITPVQRKFIYFQKFNFVMSPFFIVSWEKQRDHDCLMIW